MKSRIRISTEFDLNSMNTWTQPPILAATAGLMLQGRFVCFLCTFWIHIPGLNATAHPCIVADHMATVYHPLTVTSSMIMQQISKLNSSNWFDGGHSPCIRSIKLVMEWLAVVSSQTGIHTLDLPPVRSLHVLHVPAAAPITLIAY